MIHLRPNDQLAAIVEEVNARKRGSVGFALGISGAA
jgi:hypothetical protein